jgi:hypothetical protein
MGGPATGRPSFCLSRLKAPLNPNSGQANPLSSRATTARQGLSWLERANRKRPAGGASGARLFRGDNGTPNYELDLVRLCLEAWSSCDARHNTKYWVVSFVLLCLLRRRGRPPEKTARFGRAEGPWPSGEANQSSKRVRAARHCIRQLRRADGRGSGESLAVTLTPPSQTSVAVGRAGNCHGDGPAP